MCWTDISRVNRKVHIYKKNTWCCNANEEGNAKCGQQRREGSKVYNKFCKWMDDPIVLNCLVRDIHRQKILLSYKHWANPQILAKASQKLSNKLDAIHLFLQMFTQLFR